MNASPSITRTAGLPVSDDSRQLLTSSTLRAALALATGGRLVEVLEDGGDGRSLFFRIEGGPPNFVTEHQAGHLSAQTDRVEREHAYLTGIIRENSRVLTSRARTNRAVWSASSAK